MAHSVHFGSSIGQRLALGFGVLLLMLLAVLGADSLIGSKNRATLLQGIALANAKIALTTTMKSEQLEGVVSIRSIGLYTDPAAMNKEESNLRQHRKDFLDARDALMAMGVSPQAKLVFDNIARLDKELEKPVADAISYALAFNSEGVAQVIAERTDPIYRQMLKEINQLVDLYKAEERAVLEAAEASGRHLQFLTFGIGAVALVLGVLLARSITVGITRPLRYAVQIAKHVAQGDMTSRIEVRSTDEIGQLMQELATMNHNLAHTVGQIRNGSQAIATAAQQISSGNDDLSSRTEQQASALQQTASTTEELTATVKQNAESAHRADELAQSASQVAVKDGEAVQGVVQMMHAINTSSRKIVEIISVIDGIAFQTNILALNAAVEAARAGEQGRGFAVVASEVRSLAQRSAEAAKEIKGLINDSVHQVERGGDMVSQAGDTMTQVVESIHRVSGIMAEINAASAEQTVGIEQVNKAISEMDGVTQQNAALVEQASAAANALRTQAEKLAELVSVFTIDEGR